MLQIYEKRADNVVQKRVFLIFLGLLLMQTLAFAPVSYTHQTLPTKA